MTQDGNRDFSAFSGPDGKPTEAERKLIEATQTGTGAFCDDLADDEKLVSVGLIEALAVGTFSHADWKDWRQHPFGLWLRGATIADRLILENRNVPIKLSFDNCRFNKGFDFDGANINGSLFLRRCTITGGCSLVSTVVAGQFSADNAIFDNPGGTAINAQGVRSMGWFINDVTVNGLMDVNNAEIAGQVSANQARFEAEGVAVQAFGISTASWFMKSAVVKGRFIINSSSLGDGFYAEGAHFSNPGDDAIWAQRAKAGTWILYGATVEGRIDIHEAEINGLFNANAAKFVNPGGVALWGQGIKASSWFMCSATLAGTFDVNSAVITGQFAANETLFGESDVAVLAYAAEVGSWFMDESTVNGRFDLNGTTIKGHFSAERTQFEHADFAFSAIGAKAASWSMMQAKIRGNFNLYNVSIEGYFGAAGASFENPKGCAFEAPFARFGSGLFLRDGVTVTGDVDLAGATIGKVLDLADSSFNAVRYTAIRLQDAHIEGDAVLTSSTFRGIVDCTRAKFDGRLTFRNSVLIAPSVAVGEKLIPEQSDGWGGALARETIYKMRHHTLALNEAKIGGRLVLSRITARGIIDLSHARCDVIEDHAVAWPAPIDYKRRGTPGRLYVTENETRIDVQHMVLDGFEYGYFEFPDGSGASEDQRSNKDVAQARVDWLAAQSADDLVERFNPQPWRQASSVLRSMGYDRASQIISIERRVRERYARDMPRRQKFVSWLLHLVADYGFNPWKTVAISMGVVLLWAAVYWAGTTLCGDPNLRGAAGQCGGQPLFIAVQHGDVDARFADTGGYPAFGPIAYSLDAFVPLFDFGTETYWRPNARAWADVTLEGLGLEQPLPLKIPLGYLLHWLFIVERFLGAILIAIAVTGFTGLLTRDEK